MTVHIHFEKGREDDQIHTLLVTEMLKAISELGDLGHEGEYFSSTSTLFILILNTWWVEYSWGGARFPE